MKNKNKLMSIVLILIILDQTVKLMIANWWMDDHADIIGSMIKFEPHINSAYSWLNSLFGLGVGLMPHLILGVLILLLIIFLYDYIQNCYGINKWTLCIFSLGLSGAVCSLIDKIFWGGSLDFIYLKGLFIFDIKDMYLTGMGVTIILSNIVNYRQLKEIDKHKYDDLRRYIKLRFQKKESR